MTGHGASKIPSAVWVLGWVSLLMDVASELIHSVLPLFMAGVLGAPVWLIGLIEGVAEATALLLRVFSGMLSDYLGKRKALAALGYGLGAASKPLFALASSAAMVCAARTIDRIGKGIRAAPRDALVADVAPSHARGAAFGLRQALDKIGALLGPLLAVLIMLWSANDYRLLFWLATIPAVLAVLLLLYGVREPAPAPAARRSNPLRAASLRRLGGAYWWVVALGALFTLARFSEAFLLLRAHHAGIALAYVPLVLGAMNLVYAATAYPFGRLSDRTSHTGLLAGGLLLLVLADLVLAGAAGWPGMLAGVALWGLHMGMTQGLLSAMVAASAPADLRATAFGFFNLFSGLATLIASITAGLLWHALGPAATFLAGAAFAGLALLALAAPALLRQRARR